MYGRSYDRKQNVICGDDDQQGWVENTVAVKSNEPGEGEHHCGKNSPDQIFHKIPLRAQTPA